MQRIGPVSGCSADMRERVCPVGSGRTAARGHNPHAQTLTMLRLLVALLLTIALGLLSRLYPIGLPLYDKSLGDALYGVAAYLGLALILPRQRPLVLASLALAWCLAVEVFQATGIPARYEQFAIVRWLIGTEFSWHDVACYFVGGAAVVAIDVTVLRRGRAARPGRIVAVPDDQDQRGA
jgi:hypothetical protein